MEPIQENAENFSLQDFVGMGLGWDTIEGKTTLFAPVFANLVNDDFIMREVVGQTGARMPVKDRKTGQVREVLMLGSNNYLGLANEPSVIEKSIDATRKYGIGCGGPPLLNGYTTLHRELEERLAAFKHCEAAMLFSAGFMANLGWATGLLGPNDVLVYDQQSHASLYDAIQLGRFEAVHFNHNDMDHLRRRLMQVRWKHAFTNVIVCVEGVYSMDGDIAPLPEIRQLCDQYAALLAIDDAHGTGVLGAHGGGTPEHFGMDGQIDIVMGTFSKIFAVTGGFVAGKRNVINYLRLLARPYMFSASLPPPVVAAVLAGLDFLRDHPERVTQLHENVAYLVKGLRAAGFETDVAVGGHSHPGAVADRSAPGHQPAVRRGHLRQRRRVSRSAARSASHPDERDGHSHARRSRLRDRQGRHGRARTGVPQALGGVTATEPWAPGRTAV